MSVEYEKLTANYPRMKTDRFLADYNNSYKYTGFADKAFSFVENSQLLRSELWERFVNQFQTDADADGGWRGEYWGKMMRGASLCYSYTKNPKLYGILKKTVSDMLDSANDRGRISSYPESNEFTGWDLWGRKYVLLGMQYFLEICKERNFAEKIKECLIKQLDYIMEYIGSEDGKKSITKASANLRGLNSSSILEPVVRMYSLTEDKRYLDFAEYIIDCGGTEIVNIFELAYENKLYPYEYPITKAYEMISCFEGLLEYYRITGNEKHLKAIINFADKVLESDFTVIGCCGCTSEFFDHSTVRQANTNNDAVKQETCVTVTLMKFLYQLTLITGNSKYADAFEISFYNAYLGSFNTENQIDSHIDKVFPGNIVEPLPFDSYSPLTAGTRGIWTGGLRFMSDKHHYGCCGCIGSAGLGILPKIQLLNSENGLVLNMFINGSVNCKTPENNNCKIEIDTDYPVSGKINVKLTLEKSENFDFLIRNPYWSRNTSVSVNGKLQEITKGYIKITREWHNGDIISLDLDMRTEAVKPIPYGHQITFKKVLWEIDYFVTGYDEEDPSAHKHLALRRGPVMLAQENRLGYSVDDPVSIKVNADGFVDVAVSDEKSAPYENIVEARVPLENGRTMLVTDYASAGKLWNEKSKMAVWMLTE